MLGHITKHRKVYITLEIHNVMTDKGKGGGYNVSKHLYYIEEI